MKKYDAIIIGFGKGGKTLAAEFAKRQKTVAIVERSDRMYGGTCINIGCIPTKTLVHLAKETPVKAMWEEKKDYYRQAIGRKEEVTSFLRNKNYHNLADNPNVTVYTGVGSFAGPDVVEVRTETEVIELQSSQIFINTGAETIVPPIDGIKENPCVYTSTERTSRTAGDCGWRLYRPGICFHVCLFRFEGDGTRRVSGTDWPRRQGYCRQRTDRIGKERYCIPSQRKGTIRGRCNSDL